MPKILINVDDDLDARLKATIPKGQVNEFVREQIRRGLDEANLHSLDEAIAHIATHDKPLLDRLGDVSP